MRPFVHEVGPKISRLLPCAAALLRNSTATTASGARRGTRPGAPTSTSPHAHLLPERVALRRAQVRRQSRPRLRRSPLRRQVLVGRRLRCLRRLACCAPRRAGFRCLAQKLAVAARNCDEGGDHTGSPQQHVPLVHRVSAHDVRLFGALADDGGGRRLRRWRQRRFVCGSGGGGGGGSLRGLRRRLRRLRRLRRRRRRRRGGGERRDAGGRVAEGGRARRDGGDDVDAGGARAEGGVGARAEGAGAVRGGGARGGGERGPREEGRCARRGSEGEPLRGTREPAGVVAAGADVAPLRLHARGEGYPVLVVREEVRAEPGRPAAVREHPVVPAVARRGGAVQRDGDPRAAAPRVRGAVHDERCGVVPCLHREAP
eukprot:Rhum_TRINITY_DN14542_c17_g1::Rhum_TRINITY_DN14542_c17_g1_i1::g.97605::m.97605